jgi:hypothetical protein
MGFKGLNTNYRPGQKDFKCVTSSDVRTTARRPEATTEGLATREEEEER